MTHFWRKWVIFIFLQWVSSFRNGWFKVFFPEDTHWSHVLREYRGTGHRQIIDRSVLADQELLIFDISQSKYDEYVRTVVFQFTMLGAFCSRTRLQYSKKKYSIDFITFEIWSWTVRRTGPSRLQINEIRDLPFHDSRPCCAHFARFRNTEYDRRSFAGFVSERNRTTRTNLFMLISEEYIGDSW